MRKVLLSIIIVLSLNIYGQNISINKTWIGSENEYFKITNTNVYFDLLHFLEKHTYKVTNDTLIIVDSLRSYSKEIQTRPFKIIKLTSDTLVLKPLTDDAKGLIQNKDTFIFIDSTKIYNPDFKFERIYFSGTPCFGDCPGLKLEIDSVGNVFFFGYYKTGKYKGLYKGKLSSEELNKLIKILKKSALDNFPTFLSSCIDAPTYEFKFSYNGKSRESKGSLVPYFNNELLIFLLDCYKISKLKKVIHNPIFTFCSRRNYQLSIGDYESIKGFPDCKIKILNDSIMLIKSSSKLYFNYVGLARYYINDNEIVIDFSENPLKISNIESNINDSITIKFSVNSNNEPLPFAHISLKGHSVNKVLLSTDIDGNITYRLKKSSLLFKGKVTYIGYQDFSFVLFPNSSKHVQINMESIFNKKNIINIENIKLHSFEFKKGYKKRCYLLNDEEIKLVLKKQINANSKHISVRNKTNIITIKENS